MTKPSLYVLIVHTRKPKFDEKALGGSLKYKNLSNSVAKITYEYADCATTQRMKFK